MPAMSIFKLNALQDALDGQNISYRPGEPMSLHTGFRAGGSAAIAIFPSSIEDLIYTLNAVDGLGIPSVILGGGSNTLFCDGCFDGAVIITNKIKCYSIQSTPDGRGATVTAECGMQLTSLAKKVSEYAPEGKYGLSGLEFAYGIPGTVGGAVAMNAGAYGGEMKDIVRFSQCYDRISKKIVTLMADEHDFSYRHSIFSKRSELIVLYTTLLLTLAPRDEIKALMQKNIQARRDKQPLEYPSCGSTFLRPEGRFVGQMTEECGLKGYTVGGAQLSQKHGGFVINSGGATATDILDVIKHVKATVKEKYDVALECEIKIISDVSKEKL